MLAFPVVISIEAFFKEDEFVRTRIFPVLLFDCTTAHTSFSTFLRYQYALPRVNDNIVAEDLVQETFLSALRGLEGYNWLFAILKNKIIDHYRKKTTEQAIVTMPVLNVVEDDWFNDEGR